MYNPKLIILISLSCIILFSTSIVIAQDKFEGKVTFKAKDEGEEQLMTYWVKGNKVLIEQTEGEGAGQGAMIYDSETQMMTVLMNEQKMYMEMPMNTSQNVPDADSMEPEYFAKTGESIDILGHPCDKFEFKDKDKKGIAWMTKKLGQFPFMSNPKDMQSSNSQWQDEIMGAGYFPLLVKEEDSSGELKTVFEVTELLSMDLDDAMFLPKPGFSKFTMPNMPNMPNMMDMKKNNE